MKLFWKDALTGLFMGLVVPGMMLNFAALLLEKSDAVQTASCGIVNAPLQETVQEEGQEEGQPLGIHFLNSDGKVEAAQMDAYLVGVVLAEMPVWFEEEALKAQAVVARTYALKARLTGGKHGNGSICTQSGCCQAYISEGEFLQKGGTAQDVERVRAAVAQTSDFVLAYNGELIEATYFSCSGGSTEDAVAVWGTAFPYLQAVDSPGEEAAAHYTDTEFLEGAEFCHKLGIAPEGTPESWIGEIAHTSGGGIAEAVIGGRTFTGVQLRSLLGLRSTAITMVPEKTGITLITKGFGHRVGMSQYGADAMAASGSTWQEILAHYYTGTVPEHWQTFVRPDPEGMLHDA